MYNRLLSQLLVLFCFVLLFWGRMVDGANLIKNGDFEKGTDGWHLQEAKGLELPGKIDKKNQYTGKASLVMTLPGVVDARYISSDRVLVDPEKSYNLTMMLKCSDVPENTVEIRFLQYGVDEATNKMKVIGWLKKPGKKRDYILFKTGGSYAWKKFELRLPARTINKSTKYLSLFITHKIVGLGELELDNISFTLNEPVQSKSNIQFQKCEDAQKDNAVNHNLFKNGNFEQGTVGWHWQESKGLKFPGRIDKTAPYSGKSSCMMTQAGVTGARYISSDRIAVAPDKSYKLTMMLECSNVSKGAIEIRLLQYGLNQTTGKVKVLGWVKKAGKKANTILFKTGGSYGWKKFELLIPAGTMNQAANKLSLFITHKKIGTGHLKVDDVSLFEIVNKELKQNSSSIELNNYKNLLIGDSSFETGIDGWTVGENDKTTAFHGNCSLRLSTENGSEAHSKRFYFLIKPQQPYIFSFYAKANRKNSKINLRIRHFKYANLAIKSFTLTTEWQRYEIAIPVQAVIRNLFFVATLLNAEPNTNVWLDALQLQAGNSVTPYISAESITLTVSNPPAPGNIIFASGEPLKLKIGIRNYAKPIKDYILNYLTTDYYGNIINERTEKISILKDAIFQKTVTVLPAQKTGYYVTSATLLEPSGKIIKATKVPFGIVTPPPSGADSEDSFFGIHIGNESLAALKRIGVKWIRGFLIWRYSGKIKGQTTLADDMAEKFIKNNFSLVECIKITSMPEWAKAANGKLKNINDYAAWCRLLVNKFGKDIKYWEIENEPDVVFPSTMGYNKQDAGKYYAEILKAASGAIKQADPSAKVVAMGVSACINQFNFSEACLKTEPDAFDIMAPHPYTGPRDIAPGMTYIGPDSYLRERLLILNGLLKTSTKNKELWIGELGWSIDFRVSYLSKYSKTHANYMARAFIIARSVPSVKKLMWFKSLGCYFKTNFSYGIWRSELEPLPAAVFYANLVKMLLEVKPVKPIFQNEIQAYCFERKDGMPVLALWKYKGNILKLSADIHPASIKVIDLLGNSVKLIRKNNKTVIPVQESPLFIIGKGISTEQLCDKIGNAEIAIKPVKISLFYSDIKSLSGFIKNNLPHALKTTVSLVAPTGMEIINNQQQLELPPSGNCSFTFKLKKVMPKVKIADDSKLEVSCQTRYGKITKSIKFKLNNCLKIGSELNKDLIVLRKRSKIYPPDPGIGWHGENDLSVKANISWDNSYFYFYAAVKDDIHNQDAIGSRGWNGDSVQLSFDPLNDAQEGKYKHDNNDSEFIAYLHKDGTSRLYRLIAPKGEATGLSITNAKTVITRSPGITTYNIAIPWAQLKPLSSVPGRIFGFNFIVNDNDGNGRAYWIGLTLGIGEMKYPYCFEKFIIK